MILINKRKIIKKRKIIIIKEKNQLSHLHIEHPRRQQHPRRVVVDVGKGDDHLGGRREGVGAAVVAGLDHYGVGRLRGQGKKKVVENKEYSRKIVVV